VRTLINIAIAAKALFILTVLVVSCTSGGSGRSGNRLSTRDSAEQYIMPNEADSTDILANPFDVSNTPITNLNLYITNLSHEYGHWFKQSADSSQIRVHAADETEYFLDLISDANQQYIITHNVKLMQQTIEFLRKRNINPLVSTSGDTWLVAWDTQLIFPVYY
jgi:hypothetical protein